MQSQCALIAQSIKGCKTYEFLRNDPKLQSTVIDNFLVDVFWLETLEPAEDLK